MNIWAEKNAVWDILRSISVFIHMWNETDMNRTFVTVPVIPAVRLDIPDTASLRHWKCDDFAF